jgi:hypothetical protein
MDDRGRGAAPRFQHSELASALRAVRALDAVPTSRGRVPAVLLFSAILLGLLHTAAVTRFPSYPVGATASAAFGAGNEDVSMQFKKMAAVVSSALAVSAGAHAQDAVQWRVEDGGNGHWYALNHTLQRWSDAQAGALLAGGYLVTLTSSTEHAFVLALAAGAPPADYFLGAYNDSENCTLTSWRWVTNEPFTFTVWMVNEPDCIGWSCGGGPPGCGTVAELIARPDQGTNYGKWADESPAILWNGVLIAGSSIIEYSADCNSDGIVDYGQIRAGELVDANANNIPDCCEQSVSCSPCPGDVDESGTVNGVDLAAILAVWGSDGGKYPRADTNNDGVVNGSDLATVLGSWGSCE